MPPPPKPPMVTVGMPLYNCARHLRQSLDALLGQTFSDFELIISDNASTDDTSGICREYAEKDARIRYIRQESNIGAPRNWNAVAREARGAYFRWASGNDYSTADMLETCVDVLERNPAVVLCYGRTALVGNDGEPLGVYPGDINVLEGSAAARLEHIRDKLEMNNAQQGLMRTEVLHKTALDRLYPGGDLALMGELGLYGRFQLLDKVLLYRRHAPGAVMAMRSPEEVQRIYNPQAKKPIRMLRGRFHLDHFVSVARAPLPAVEKLKAWSASARRVIWDRNLLLAEFRTVLFPPAPRNHA